jgi:DNA methylase
MPLTQIRVPVNIDKFTHPPAYFTDLGAAFCGDSLELLNQLPDESINLVLTSPPFALQREKEYGNKDAADYVEWLAEFAKLVYQKLKPDGSFVLDLGGAYEKAKFAGNSGYLINYKKLNLSKTLVVSPLIPIHKYYYCDNP